MSESLVYFIQAGEYIKIGITTNIKARLLAIQNGCPMPIVLLRTVSGGSQRESNIHRRFSKIRARNEWFRDTPELREYIQALPYENDTREYSRRSSGEYSLPDWLSQLLEERNMTLRDLCLLSGLYEETICGWASTRLKTLGGNNISISGKVAKVLNMKHSEFETLREIGLERAGIEVVEWKPYRP